MPFYYLKYLPAIFCLVGFVSQSRSGGQAAMEAAKNIADLTALNMGAMAAQNRVLETNPTKQKIAGRYFR